MQGDGYKSLEIEFKEKKPKYNGESSLVSFLPKNGCLGWCGSESNHNFGRIFFGKVKIQAPVTPSVVAKIHTKPSEFRRLCSGARRVEGGISPKPITLKKIILFSLAAKIYKFPKTTNIQTFLVKINFSLRFSYESSKFFLTNF